MIIIGFDASKNGSIEDIGVVRVVAVVLTFLMIITRNGNLIPSVFFGSAGQVI